MMVEAQAIGEKLGVRFPIDVDQRIDGAAAVGAHKTSMLQDLERGRPMEIDALVGAVPGDWAGWSGCRRPTIDIGPGAGAPAGPAGRLLRLSRQPGPRGKRSWLGERRQPGRGRH